MKEWYKTVLIVLELSHQCLTVRGIVRYSRKYINVVFQLKHRGQPALCGCPLCCYFLSISSALERGSFLASLIMLYT